MKIKTRQVIIVLLFLLMILGLNGCGRQVASEAGDSVVYISGNYNGGNGFIVYNSVDQTYILTTVSVLGEKYGEIQVNTLNSSRMAEVIAINSNYDLALLRLEKALNPTKYPAINFNNSYVMSLGKLYSVYFSDGITSTKVVSTVSIDGRYNSQMKNRRLSADIYTLAKEAKEAINGAPIIAGNGEAVGIASYSHGYAYGVHHAVITAKVINQFLTDNGFNTYNITFWYDIVAVVGVILVIVGITCVVAQIIAHQKKKIAAPNELINTPEMELQAMIDNVKAKHEKQSMPIIVEEPTSNPREDMICPACRRKVASDSTFCCYCGRWIPDNTCYKCGTELRPDASFCHKCGNSRKEQITRI